MQINVIGRHGIRHDRRRIGVDQRHLYTLFAQGTAGLRAGIVKFAGLADDDGAGADDENGLNGCIAWHIGSNLAFY